MSHACSPSVSIDRFSDALDKTTYDGTFVGNFSALAVDKDGSLAALSDRSSLFDLDARTLAAQVGRPARRRERRRARLRGPGRSTATARA